MNRTTAFSAPLAALALAATPACAEDDDFQVWIGETASTSLDDGTVATLDLSQRFREIGDQLLARATVEFRLSENAVIGGGGAYVSTVDDADEVRPHQQLTLTFGALALRTRVEERFFEGADRMELRLREKATVTVPLSSKLKAGFAGELLYLAQTRNSGQGARVDQWRANATLSRELGAGLEGTLGYLAILSPREGAPDRLSHVAQISVSLRR